MKDHTSAVLSGIALVGAALVAFAGHDGWGWLLTAGLVLGIIDACSNNDA